jgi:hypothetical protein
MTDNPIDNHASPDAVESDNEAIENDLHLKNQGKIKHALINVIVTTQKNATNRRSKRNLKEKHMMQEMLQLIVKRSLKFLKKYRICSRIRGRQVLPRLTQVPYKSGR